MANQELPEIDAFENDVVEEISEPKKQKKKTFVVLIIAFIMLLVILVFGLFAYKEIKSELSIEESISSTPPLEPIQLVGRMELDKPKPQAIELNPIIIDQDDEEVVPDSSEFPEVDLNSYEVDFESMDKKIDSLAKHISLLTATVDDVQKKQAVQDARDEEQDKVLASIRNQLSSLTKKFNLFSSNKSVATAKPTPKPSNQPAPPKPLSFAKWNGRDAVVIEEPVGRVKLIYVGDTTLNKWSVQKIDSNSVSFKSLLNGQVKVVKVGG